MPRQNLLGELHSGWRITQGSLAHEGGMLWIGNATSIERNVEGLVRTGREWGFAGAPLFRDELASLYVDGQAMKLMGYRGFAGFARAPMSPEQSLLEPFSSEIERRSYLASEWLGEAAVDLGLPGPLWNGWRDGDWAQQHLRSFAGTIAGGTSEVQRNIVAERVLGLPR